MLSKKLRKRCSLSVGDIASVIFDIADQEAVDVPDQLRFAWQADDDALAIWGNLSAGKRRTFAMHVASAKMAETSQRQGSYLGLPNRSSNSRRGDA